MCRLVRGFACRRQEFQSKVARMNRLVSLALIGPLVACGETPSSSPDATIPTTNADAAVAIDAPAMRRCEGLAAQPSDSEWVVVSGGRDRIAKIHVPASYDPSEPTSVVFNFHGFSSTANQQALIARMLAKSDDAGFIVVHATGVGIVNSWNGGTCCGVAAEQDVDDVAFVSDLIDELERRVCVDPARVYATGFSNGGFLSHRLACELSDRIAAIAPVAGVVGIDGCNPIRPMPVLHFHGDADLVVPYGGSMTLGFSSVADSYSLWSDINGCTGEEKVPAQGDATCVSATGCSDGGELTLCTIDGGGHTWPGGVPIPGAGKTSTDISATDVMWDFFERHRHPAF